MSQLNRRNFLHGMGAVGTGIAVSGSVNAAEVQTQSADPQKSRPWSQIPDRVWIGPEYWANPLQDWQITEGRLECVNAAANRNVHWLTRSLGEKTGPFEMRVTIGRAEEGTLAKGKGSAGFRIGIRGPLEDYRNAIVFGNGLDVGFNVIDGLFIGRIKSKKKAEEVLDRQWIKLQLAAEPTGDDYRLTLSALDAESGKLLDQIQHEHVPADRLHGNIALVNNHAGGGRRGNRPAYGLGRFQFADWQATGTKIEDHPERAYGPILFSQYTLSGGILKMTAQMPPVGEHDSKTVRLQIHEGGNKDWKTIVEEKIHPQARTATFRIADWNDTQDTPYRLVYTQKYKSGVTKDYEWTGTVRRDPVDQDVVTVADVSCNIHAAFPNDHFVKHMAKLDPDLIAFVGDQFYESTGGYGTQRAPLDMAILDYLRKWWLHGWTWRELTRDRPSLSIPDDHDVYQGNVWGEGGAGKQKTQEAGGYALPAEWVNVVHRTQTSHHPDPYDPRPAKQNISVYFGAMTYGRLSFAIIADRMFKTGPDGEVPATGGRADHVTDPNFDPKSADLPGLELLGERQLKFLRDWATDWKGADMKAVVSQTIFTAMATTHGGNRQRLVADYDANGWPQSERNKALKEIRKAFAVHLAGDQHLPAVIHYGVDEFRDAGVAFAGPAVNVGYPRWFEPTEPGKNRKPESSANSGDFLDHFGNPMTVLAVKNGDVKPPPKVLENLQGKASGLGVVRFDKKNREITIECWPFLTDPTTPDSQFPGWPVTIKLEDNYARKAAAYLPTLKIQGPSNPVVQVLNERTGEIEYTLRISGNSFQPKVFDPDGRYTIKIGAEEAQSHPGLTNLKPDAEGTIEVRI